MMHLDGSDLVGRRAVLHDQELLDAAAVGAHHQVDPGTDLAVRGLVTVQHRRGELSGPAEGDPPGPSQCRKVRNSLQDRWSRLFSFGPGIEATPSAYRAVAERLTGKVVRAADYPCGRILPPEIDIGRSSSQTW